MSAMKVAYAEGWQSWTPPTRAPEGRGLLVAAEPGGPAHAWLSREGVPIRLEHGEPSADGPVEELEAASVDAVLAAVADRLSPGPPRAIPPGWCSWSQYFAHVTDADVVENVDAALELGLPIEIVQVDDGWEAGIGDWLDVSPRFGSLREVVARIEEAGMRPVIWTAPFLVGERSTLAAAHPDWIVTEADAGRNWGQALRVLDVATPAAAEYLAHVFRTLVDWGFAYFKLDFLFAGTLPASTPTARGSESCARPPAPTRSCSAAARRSSRASASWTQCGSGPTCCPSCRTRHPTFRT